MPDIDNNSEGLHAKKSPTPDQSDTEIYDIPYEHCVACGSTAIKEWRTKSYAYSTGQSEHSFSINRCTNCNMGFLNPPPHDALLKKIYSYSGHGLTEPVSPQVVIDREKQNPSSTLDAKRMITAAKALSKSSNMKALDIGSGYGFFTRELRDAGYSTTSINPGKYENAVFQALNDDLPIPIYFDEFSTDERFDVIMMSQVLEHIKSPKEVVEKAHSLLEPGGVLICAVPNFNSISVKLRGTNDNGCLWIPEHVNFFTEGALNRLFENCGFSSAQSEYVTRIPYDALSRRIRWLNSDLLELLMKQGQKPISWILDRMGYGFYMTMYGIKN